jgi:hypothetical protein
MTSGTSATTRAQQVSDVVDRFVAALDSSPDHRRTFPETFSIPIRCGMRSTEGLFATDVETVVAEHGVGTYIEMDTI